MRHAIVLKVSTLKFDQVIGLFGFRAGSSRPSAASSAAVMLQYLAGQDHV